METNTESVLSRREYEVLRLAASGLPTKEIALTLEVTNQTVKYHLTNIYKKLAISNRAQAVGWFLSHR